MRTKSIATALLALAVGACGGSASGPTTAAPAADPAGVVITIADFDFGEPITVTAGETITVRNVDSVTHTFTSADGVFDSGRIAGGETFAVSVDAPGEYAFFCGIHPSMTGTLTVAGEGAAMATPTTTTTAAAPEATDSVSPRPMAPADVVFEEQASNGASVTVASVTLPAPGFVAVHADADGVPGPVIGYSALLPAGTSVDVVVFLDSRLQESAVVFPMAHIDVDGDGIYDFAPPDVTTDGPASTVDGEVAVAGARVVVEIDY